MKTKALFPALVVLVVAIAALLTAFAVTRNKPVPHAAGVPNREIVDQQVVTAPPLADPGNAAGPAAAARSSVMGGPPDPGHASR